MMGLGAAVWGTLCACSPVFATRIKYRYNFHRGIHLRNPRTLDEKIQWLKLNTYRDNPLVTQCADKYLVRAYVEECGCGEILNDLLYVWDHPSEIEWDRLPESFVIKCNHGCGYNLLCRDKAGLNVQEAQKQLTAWYNEDYWKISAEIQYRKIPKKVICERFIGDGSPLYDYKFYCFNGKAQYVMVCAGREQGKPKFYFFDRDWRFCPITRDGKNAPEGFTLPRPEAFDRMMEYAEKLSRSFPFVRTDLYDADGKVIFGELTFTPASGLDTNRLPETDLLFGSMLKL